MFHLDRTEWDLMLGLIFILSYISLSHVLFAAATIGIATSSNSPLILSVWAVLTLTVCFYVRKHLVLKIEWESVFFWTLIFSTAWVLVFQKIPIFRTDDLIYHAFVPKNIAELGSFRFDPFNLNSNLPMLFELPVIVVHFWFELSPLLLNLSVGFFIAISIDYWISENSPHARWIGRLFVLAFFSIPDVYLQMTSLYVELFLALLFLWCFILYTMYLNRRRTIDLILLGVVSGAMCATKYSSYVLLLPLIAHFILFSSDRKMKVIFCSTWFVVVGPWIFKNLYYLGNPIFPLLPWISDQSWFSVDRLLRYENLVSAYRMGDSFKDYLLLPFRILLLQDHTPSVNMLGFDGSLSILALIGIGAFVKRSPGFQSNISRLVLVCAGLFFFVWAIVSQQTRFLLPPVLVLTLFGFVYLLQQGTGMPTRIASRIRWLSLLVFLVAAAGLGLRDTLHIAEKNHTSALIKGNISRLDFLKKHTAWPLLFENDFDRLDSAGSAIVTIGDFGRNFYYNFPVVAQTYFEEEYLWRSFYQKNDPEVFSTWLQTASANYILWNQSYLLRTAPEDDPNYIEKVYAWAEKNTRIVREVGPLQLLEIVSK